MRFTAFFFVALLLSGCQAKKPQAHYVLIAYPEHWNEGEHKPCFFGSAGGSTVSRAIGQPDIPQLDCDRFVQGELIHRTPAERIFAIDVEIKGGVPELKRTDEIALTCQREGEDAIITCAP
jgi:hypothetical protein